MNIYEFIALSRSGHHAILNWIFQNLVGFQIEWNYKITRLGDSNLYYINEGSFNTGFSFEFIENNFKNIKNLFVGYENVKTNFTIFRDDNIFRGPISKMKYSEKGATLSKRILIIRDFYNNLASRVRANKNEGMFINTDGKPLFFDVKQNFIDTWKDMARAIVDEKITHIKYEDWLENSEIRKKFLLDNFNTLEIYDFDNVKGTSSSFGESKNYKNRFDPELISDEIKDLIRKDNELHYLIGALGYEYKKI